MPNLLQVFLDDVKIVQQPFRRWRNRMTAPRVIGKLPLRRA
jgi:hypothetical protein